VLATAALFSVVLGCGSSNDDESRVRVFHASPDAPNVDVLIDGGLVLEDVPYQTASDFLEIESGHRQVAVTATGTDTAVIDQRVDFAKDTDYLLIASGKLASIKPIIAITDRSSPAQGSAKIRVLHAAPSAPAVDIYVVPTGQGILNATPVLSAVPFGVISDYLVVPQGTYDVRVTVAGTKTVAIESNQLNIGDGLIATVAALDASGAGSPFSLAVQDERRE
jgi:PHD/YefM family antitoxin component YafN of YafNO toxin-antitoxin module